MRQKPLHKYHWINFVLVILWPWDLSWSVVNISSGTPLETTNFSYVSGYQLQIASWLGVGVQVYFSLLVLGTLSLAWTLCVTCVCSYCLCEFLCASVLLCLEDTVFLSQSSLLSLTVFLPPLPWAMREGLMMTSHLRPSTYFLYWNELSM